MARHRRERLAELIRTRYGSNRAEFISDAGLTKGRVSQLLDASASFGERAARALEHQLALPARWLDAGLSEACELVDEESPVTFGKRLRAARMARGLTQADLGRGLGTDGSDAGKAVVYGWEQGHHHPRGDQLALMCRKLGVSADCLLFGTPQASLEAVQLASALDRIEVSARPFLIDIVRNAMELAKLPRS